VDNLEIDLGGCLKYFIMTEVGNLYIILGVILIEVGQRWIIYMQLYEVI
jgi:hypothetical protein